MLGIGALLYPSAADWFATRDHSSEVTHYTQQVHELPETTRQALLQVARDYNADTSLGVLRDPYTNAAAQEALAEDTAYQSYLDVLSVGDSKVMGQVSYPSLGIDLPIYHGTSGDVLTKGVGHLYGSSLPVGGSSTHAVMTSHSGLVNASLFTDLPDAEVGDIFTVTVLGEKHHYEVRNLENVLPHETESLQVVDGEDWVTLITCTPVGVNSHRLLVQGQRIPAPSHEEAAANSGGSTGFPWWMLIFLAGSGAVAYLVFSSPRKKVSGKAQHARTSHETGETP
jgi:sortase A